MSQVEDLRSPAVPDDSYSIVVKDVTKVYKLYPDPQARMKEALSMTGKIYHKDFYALRNVSFEVKKGEVLGIIGKNGSGKSTLLKIITSVIQPTEGYATINGTVAALLELGAAFNPEFSGIENIYFYGSVLGFPRSFLDGKLDEILAFADIGEFIHQPLKKYSSGMRSRLAFAVAINVDPDILILDEVLAVGDELFKRKCYARMEHFMKGDKTILFVTHNTTHVNELCRRALLLDQGELILGGPSKLVTSQYQRFLFSKPEDAKEIRNQILRLDMSSPSNPSARAGKSDEAATTPDASATAPNDEHRSHGVRDLDQKPYLIPNLAAKSTVEYKYYGVEIFDVMIQTKAGEKVNSLVVNDSYVYSYKVGFDLSVQNVLFGMMFKTQRGLTITSANTFDMYNSTVNAEKGEKYLVEWHFLCRLLPRAYYTDVGVLFLQDGERRILNRIVDAMVFYVQKLPRKYVAGLVHLDQVVSVTRMR
jgi:lipopolysaccharide transport system ATP-binding protein